MPLLSNNLTINLVIFSIMRTLIIDLPETLDINDREAKMVLASKLYELGKLSLGQAAQLVGYSKETFMELLADYGVSFFNYPVQDLKEDVTNAQYYSL